jgi:hypothetical protein
LAHRRLPRAAGDLAPATHADPGVMECTRRRQLTQLTGPVKLGPSDQFGYRADAAGGAFGCAPAGSPPCNARNAISAMTSRPIPRAGNQAGVGGSSGASESELSVWGVLTESGYGRPPNERQDISVSHRAPAFAARTRAARTAAGTTAREACTERAQST